MRTRTKDWHINYVSLKNDCDSFIVVDDVTGFKFIGCIEHPTHALVLPYLEVQPGFYCDSGFIEVKGATPVSVWRPWCDLGFQLLDLYDLQDSVHDEFDESAASTELRSIKYKCTRRQYHDRMDLSSQPRHGGLSTIIESIILNPVASLVFNCDTVERAFNLCFVSGLLNSRSRVSNSCIEPLKGSL